MDMTRTRRLILALLALASVAGPIAADARDRDGERRGGGRPDHEQRGDRGPNRGGDEYRGDRRGGPKREPQDYGPPPGVRVPYTPPMRRGGYIPPDYDGGVIADPGRYRLRPPPRGYVWVRAGDGYALVSTATGQVFDVVPY